MIRDQKLWTWHLLAGLVILVFLGLHMVTMHMESVIELRGLNPAGEGVRPIAWENVKARGVQTFYMATYILLLGAALFHGLYGAWNIFFELNPKAWLKKLVGTLIVLVGSGLFVFGAWAAVMARTVARGQ
jgi:succinate dehydrogenase hydrophobic anchor subunit